MIQKILSHIQSSEKIHKEIMKLIGYSGKNNSPMEKCDSPWSVEKDELRIFTNKNCDDYWVYKISSYSAKGEQLFMCQIEGNQIIMAHPWDEPYHDTTIFILDENNKVTTD